VLLDVFLEIFGFVTMIIFANTVIKTSVHQKKKINRPGNTSAIEHWQAKPWILSEFRLILLVVVVNESAR